MEQRRGARPRTLRRVVRQHLGHVRAEPAGLRDDIVTAVGIGAQLPVAAGLGQQLLGALDGQLVRRGALRDVRPLLAALQVRPVPADPHGDVAVAQPEAVDRPRVDVVDVTDELLEALVAVLSEVEPLEPRHPPRVAAGYRVQRVFHAGGEVVVDQVAEVLLQQRDHREREERRHQRGALLEHVPAVEDRADDRRVRRRTADLPVFHLLDQRRLGVAGRRAGGVPLGLDGQRGERVLLGQIGQPPLAVVQLGLGVVGALDVGLEEAVEGDDLAGRGELGGLPGAGVADHPDRHRVTGGVLHLAGDRALPDQLVQAEVVAAQARLRRRAEAVTGRAHRLVRLLGVLHLALVGARRVRHVLRAVELPGLRAGGVDRRLRQRDAVGPHVGDVAVLVQLLRHLHRVLGGEAELAGRLLLQRRGAKRRVRRALVRLALNGGDRERGALQAGGQAARGLLVEVQRVGGAGGQLAARGEVAALGDTAAVDRHQAGGETGRHGGVGVLPARVERAGQVPVVGRAERDALPLALDDQPGGHGLHPPGRQAGHDLLPQDGRDLVAVQAVQDAAGLLGVDQLEVDVARRLDGAADGVRRDLVEHHAAHRDLRVEHLVQVPCDGLALAVLVRGQVELVGAGQQVLELLDLLLLRGVDDVQRLEVVVDVDTETGPRLLLEPGRDLGGLVGQVTDVADAGLDHVPRPEITRDGLRLRRRLDDDKPGTTVPGLRRACLSCHYDPTSHPPRNPLPAGIAAARGPAATVTPLPTPPTVTLFRHPPRHRDCIPRRKTQNIRNGRVRVPVAAVGTKHVP